MSERREAEELEELEISLLLEGLHRWYGIDLRDYARGTLRRHLVECLQQEQLATVSGFQDKVLHDTSCLDRLLLALSLSGTTMFRDPAFYLALRTRIVPLLRTFPFVRLWLAGCSTGEEIYSLAILLEEEGLYSRSRIYATDLSREAVRRAREGVFPLAGVREYTSNYLHSGGRRYLSDYYKLREGRISFDSELKRNITFSEHNLATDGSFNEFQVVLCRNILSQFNPLLQERVHELIYESLDTFGVLGLGSQESLKYSPREAFYEPLDQGCRLYRKVL